MQDQQLLCSTDIYSNTFRRGFNISIVTVGRATGVTGSGFAEVKPSSALLSPDPLLCPQQAALARPISEQLGHNIREVQGEDIRQTPFTSGDVKPQDWW